MREIKFRAWHKGKKIIGNVLGIDILHKEIFFSNENVDCYEHVDFKNIELMQYTGLKDKNGKEIYEGDIVKFLNGIFEVIWCNEKASFMLKNKEFKEFLNFIYENNNGMEIVGNIYQNLELYEEVR